MIIRKSLNPPIPYSSRLHHFSLPRPAHRALHARASPPPIPAPTPFVPDASTFLSLIGRGLSQHAAKISTWESLFSLTSTQLRDLGVEPARSRRYLLWWRERFRKGVFGVGGDLKHVHNGEAEVRVLEVPVALPPTQGAGKGRSGPGRDQGQNIPLPKSAPVAGGISPAVLPPARVKMMVVNEPPRDQDEEETVVARGPKVPVPRLEDLSPVEGMRVKGPRTIVGPYIYPVKGTGGSVAKIRVQEGMWEVRRGVKVDGGERRKVQVRRKRLLEARKSTRK
ncbi:MAG: hypothetical protein Q9163_005517 [Psora crenata]